MRVRKVFRALHRKLPRFTYASFDLPVKRRILRRIDYLHFLEHAGCAESDPDGYDW